jgi:DNA-binding transcriptional regulator LsrR (DeoR family)
MKKQHLHLSEGDRTYLEELVRQGELPVKVYRRAIGLLELDRGKSYTAVAETLGLNPTTVSKLAQKCSSQQHVAVRSKMDKLPCYDPNSLSPYNSLTTEVAIREVGRDKGCC